jgi:hypothetical protein
MLAINPAITANPQPVELNCPPPNLLYDPFTSRLFLDLHRAHFTRNDAYCSAYNCCYATIRRWADIPDTFLDNG